MAHEPINERSYTLSLSLSADRRFAEIRQIANLTITKRENPNRNRVYDQHGIAPTVYNFAGGGNLQPLIPIVTEN